MTFDRFDPSAVRMEIARREPWRNVSMSSDDELVDEWMRAPEREDWFDRAAKGGNAYGVSEPAAEPAIEDLAVEHFIEFEVQDGAGDPYPDLAYALRGPEGDVEEGTLSGPIRRDGVPNDDYALTIKTIDALAWGAEKTICAQAIALRGRVSGHADGTEVEIRIFRELRETDDDVLETLQATVEDGAVEASWAYEPGTIEGTHAQLRFVAELRVPDAPGWVKTSTPLVVELPAIRAACWSTPQTGPGQPVDMRVELVGIADGSKLTIEVFKQRRDGSQECLDTFEGLAVMGGAVEIAWTFEPDADDALAPTEAECFFVATSEDHVDATRTSGPLWISRAYQSGQVARYA